MSNPAIADINSHDSKGRPHPSIMTDTEKLDEILLSFRQLADALESLGQSPMVRAMMPGGNLF